MKVSILVLVVQIPVIIHIITQILRPVPKIVVLVITMIHIIAYCVTFHVKHVLILRINHAQVVISM
jgi:hypothetical protein